MNILFLNLNKQNHPILISELIKEKDIDVGIFSESVNLDIDKLKSYVCGETAAEHDYSFLKLATSSDFLIFFKDAIRFNVNRGQAKYVIINITQVQNKELFPPLIIVGLHLDAMYSGAEKRRAQAEQIMRDLEEEEKKLETNNSLLIGDFNANPFDCVLLGHNYFNSVLFREIIEHKEFVKWNDRNYRRFYNPSFDCLSEKK